MFRNLLFDWSGTLCDDLNLTLEATNYVMAQYNRPALSRKEFRNEFQLPYPKYYKWKIPEAQLEDLEKHYRFAFDNALNNVTVLPYAREFMNFCKGRGIRCFALTSMDPKAFDEQTDMLGFKPYFEEIHSGIRDKETHILKLMAQHGLKAEETAMIGDMQHDMNAAHCAGITGIGVLTGYNNAQQLAESAPHVTVPNLSALQSLLERKPAPKQDRIMLKGLDFTCHIGVPEEERATAQRLTADISLVPEHPFSTMGEDIAKTIDYYQLSIRLEEIAKERPTHLLENLAHRMAECCVQEFGAMEARVEIQKYILPNASCSAVSTTAYKK